MRKRHMLIVTLFVAAAFIAANAYADAPTWKIDKDHSNIFFGIKHIYSTVKGHFGDFDGEIRFDPDNLGQSHLDFSVDVESINTAITKRDNHLQSGDFFDVDKYPEMTFESTSIKHVEGDQYTAEGVLKVKDVSRNISVPFTYFGAKPNPFNPEQLVAGFEAHLTIDRLEYHVGTGKFLQMGVVGKNVDVLITIEATREAKP